MISIQEFFTNPPDESSELNVFDLEKLFPVEIQQLQSDRVLSNAEADPVVCRILSSLPDREDLPEPQRHQIQKWLNAIRYASYLRPAPAPSVDHNPVQL